VGAGGVGDQSHERRHHGERGRVVGRRPSAERKAEEGRECAQLQYVTPFTRIGTRTSAAMPSDDRKAGSMWGVLLLQSSSTLSVWAAERPDPSS